MRLFIALISVLFFSISQSNAKPLKLAGVTMDMSQDEMIKYYKSQGYDCSGKDAMYDRVMCVKNKSRILFFLDGPFADEPFLQLNCSAYKGCKFKFKRMVELMVGHYKW